MGRPNRISNQTTKTFSERLSDLVEAEKRDSGKRQREIASAIGVSSGTLSEWCSDQKTPTIDAIPKLSAYFSVSSDWLIGLSDVKSPDSSIQGAQRVTGLSEDSILSLKEIAKESQGVKEAAFDLLNNLLDNIEFLNLAIACKRYREQCSETGKIYALQDEDGKTVEFFDEEIFLNVMQNRFIRIVTSESINSDPLSRSANRKYWNGLTNEEKADIIAQAKLDMERGK